MTSPTPVVPATGPIETKVIAATGGAGAGTAIAGIIMWILDMYVFTGTTPVPDVFTALIFAIIPAGTSFLLGWLARHTPRVDAQALAVKDPRGTV